MTRTIKIAREAAPSDEAGEPAPDRQPGRAELKAVAPSGLRLERDPAPAGETRGERSAPLEVGHRPGTSAPTAPPKRKGRRREIAIVALVVLFGGAAYFGYDWWTEGRFMVSTDDAYVGADTSVIAPKISGYVKTVAVDNNTRVTAGTPLILLDDSDYRIAEQQAEAQVAAQQAAIARIEQQIAAGDAEVSQANAQLASAKAAATNAKAEYDRATALLNKTFGTQQAVDTAQATLLQANAAVDSSTAGVSTAQANAAVLAAQKVEAERVLDQDRLAVQKAQLDLDHTVIRAPFDGVVGNKAAEPGEYVQPGTRLMAVVPLQDVYIDANFKETQLANLKPGQTAKISVDAYPDQAISGTVASIAPASGAVFSLLPPDNATGNFTKVVQRLSVRIRVPASVAAEDLIRPGMSVVVAVDTRTGASSVAER